MEEFDRATRSSLRRSSLVALVLALQCLGGVAVAQAGVPGAGVARENSAYAAFEALAARMKATGDMPRLSDPTAAPALKQLWDTRDVLGRPPYTMSDVKALQSLMSVQANVLTQYIKAGEAGGMAAAAHGDSAYQAEVSRAEAFLVTASPALLEAASDAVSKSLDLKHLTDRQKQQLGPFSRGMDGILTEVRGAVDTISESSFTAANQKVIGDALAQSGPRLAVHLTPTQRSTVVMTTAKVLAKADPAARSDLVALIGSMATDSCSALCQIGEMTAGASQQPAAPPQQAAPAAPPPSPEISPQRQPPAQTTAAGGTNILVPKPEVGALFGSQPAYACSSKATPTTGSISADLARQYFICESDSWSNGGPLWLVTNVKLQVGQPLALDQNWALHLNDADMKSPPYPIRGSFDKYQCDRLGGADAVMLSPRNCTVYHHLHASGVCYRTGGFDDWKCFMSDPSPQTAGNQPPPGPLTAAQMAAVRHEAPVGAIKKGMLLFAQGNYAGASQAFKAVTSRNPVDPMAALWNGVLGVKQGDIWADFTFSNVGSAYPIVPEFLALNSWRAGKMDAARKYLEDCMRGPDRASASRCADMEKGVESGASAPAVEDWPTDTGLVEATKALVRGGAPNG